MLIIPFYVINSIDGSLQTFLYRRPDKVFFLYLKKTLLAMQALLELHNSGVIGQKEL